MSEQSEHTNRITEGLSLPESDLTIERALKAIPEQSRKNYAHMYEWFIAGTDAPAGKRLLGQTLPKVDPAFKHCAMRGIHVPAKQRYAASITVSDKSLYADDDLDGTRIFLPDETWLLYYSPHRNNKGAENTDTWMNEGLANCLADGVPVGVFLPAKGGLYERSLAFVESFDAQLNIFTLHGPICKKTEHCFEAPKYEVFFGAVELPDADELSVDTRERRTVELAVRNGQQHFRNQLLAAYEGTCAATGGRARETLQGAHIIEHRGESANIVQNGLLLRADIHLLYDNNLLSIEPESHRIVISDELQNTEYEAMFHKGDKRIHLPENPRLAPCDDYLNVRFQKFLAHGA